MQNDNQPNTNLAPDPDMEKLAKSLRDSMTPDLAKALEYVKSNRRPLLGNPPSFTTCSSEWRGHAQSN